MGFLDTQSFRYQKSFEEIEDEEDLLKRYLTAWEINYLELISTEREGRIKSGREYILGLVKQSSPKL